MKWLRSIPTHSGTHTVTNREGQHQERHQGLDSFKEPDSAIQKEIKRRKKRT